MNSTSIFSGTVFILSLMLSGQQALSSQEKCKISSEAKYAVKIEKIREQGIVGELIRPVECASSLQNLVLVIGGSEGGVPAYLATPLAERGMTALALGYFSVEGESLPLSIDKIPLEYFENALAKIQNLVPNSKCCTVIGFSKGAEGALTFASVVKPNLLGLILISGTDTAFEGFLPNNGPGSKNSAWTYRGSQIAFSPYVVPDQPLLAKMFPKGFSYPPVLRPFYDATISLPSGTQGVLPIEQVTNSILMLSGEDDQVWSSSLMSEKAVQRAKAKGFKFNIDHYSFPSVGHFVLFGEGMLQSDPYNSIRFGGTIEGSKAAEPAAWSKITTFLEQAYQ